MGCRPSHLILIASALALVFLILNTGSYLICSIVGFVYPAYMSFKALETADDKDDR